MKHSFRLTVSPGPLDLLSEDLPDPTVLPTPGGYYFYVTNNRFAHVPVIFSADLEHFTLLGDALPRLPHWARQGFTWAPEVTPVGDGFVLYFTARLRGTPWQVIGVAQASEPQGPFRATSRPLVTMLNRGGAIDPDILTTGNGERYLYWKNDGNAAGQPTLLWGARLSADGLSLADRPVPLLTASEPWERELIEAPQVIEQDGAFHLLYSCAHFGDESYAIGHACGDGPLGLFHKQRGAPLLASHGGLAGPGHSHAFRDAGGRWQLAYHAWRVGAIGYPHGRRTLRLAPLNFQGRSVQVG